MGGAGAGKYLWIQDEVKIHSTCPSDGLHRAGRSLLCLDLCHFPERQANGSNTAQGKEMK